MRASSSGIRGLLQAASCSRQASKIVRATCRPAVSARCLSTNVALSRPQSALQPAYEVHVEIGAKVAHDGAKITVSLPDGRTTKFDHQYLLDHCRCSACCHAVTKQRLKTLVDFPAEVQPREVSLEAGGLRISWALPEVHESFYPFEVLARASYDPPLAPIAESDQILWNSKIARSPPTVEYASLMPGMAGEKDAERGVLKWLDNVHEFGFCFVSGVPTTPEATEEVIRRIGNIRETHYGGFWDFTSNMSHGDLAYSTEGLPAHTDTTYFTDPAGLQIFHMLSHPSPPGTGGTSLLVDGFYAANLLSSLYPSAYSTLSRLRVPAHASGTPGSLLRPAINQPAFRHDEAGRLAQVRWNNEDRGVLGSGWSPGDVSDWYAAARQYESLLRSEDAEYWVQLAPGTMVVIDNWRVMHGRAAFTGERRMCGAYIGADDWRSRRAALRDTLHPSSGDKLWANGW